MAISLDTNILIYWLDDQTEFHAQAKELLLSSIDHNSTLICSTVAITELLSKRGVTAKELSEMPIQWVSVNPLIAQTAGRLRQLYAGLRTPDALHLATATLAKVEQFVTNDKKLLALKKVDGMIISGLK